MGNFYTNVTLLDADGQSVRDWLLVRGVDAYILERDRRIVVFDQRGEAQDLSHELLARDLSTEFGGAVAALVHDDDLLQVTTFIDGTLADKYVSCPAVHDEEADPSPAGGDADVLVALAGSGDPNVVRGLLRGDFDFEVERHEALLRELALPPEAAGLGFHYIEVGDGPADAVRIQPLRS